MANVKPVNKKLAEDGWQIPDEVFDNIGENTEAIFEVREKTREDVLSKLKKYKKCLIIRPTGYGKTYLLTDLMTMYKKVLYLYPTEVISDTVKNRYADTNNLSPEDIETIKKAKSFDNVTLMTYAKLIRMSPEDLKKEKYDCIIADEAHRLGGPKTSSAISMLMRTLPRAHFIGATATPNRTDSLDIVSMFFSGIMCFPYTIHNAIQDGLLKKPNYCYCTYDIETDLKEAALTAGEDLNDPEVIEVLNRKIIELSEIYNMENVIKHMATKFVPNTSYMKFIVFFSNIEVMHQRTPAVEKWFKDAFPKHTVSSLFISSRNAKENENVKLLDTLTPRKKHIDLICCVDKLNMGHHASDLTGVVMFRGTSSNIIFCQQLGRALSAGAKSAALVFDVVDNLHRKAVYELNETPSDATLISMKKASMSKNQTVWKVHEDGTIRDKFGQQAPLTIDDDGKIVDLQGNDTGMYVEPGTTNIITTPAAKEILNGCNITENDINRIDKSQPLTAEGHIATYREIIAKAAAEPASQRCRLALLLHFEKWCKSNNVDYKGFETMIKTLKEESKKTEPEQHFMNDFKKFIKKAKINYPLHDLKMLTEYGEDDSDNIPLRICAIVKNVSVRSILDIILDAA